MGAINDRIAIGIDLGQRSDPTAIAVVQAELYEEEWHHTVRFLERLPLGTPYPEVVARVKQIASNAISNFKRETNYDHEIYPLLYIDATGLGQPVVDLLKHSGISFWKLYPCYFTHGDRRTVSPQNEITVGKAWMVSRLQVLLQSGRIHIPKSAEAEALAKELLDYEIRISEDANEKYGAFKVGTHDDLVTALGLATMDDTIGKPVRIPCPMVFY
jgi:hypothetical protein